MRKFVVRNTVKRFVFSAFVLALVVAPLAKAQAQALKPAVVISIASVDEHLADAEYLFTAAGQADAFGFVKLFAVPALDGIDTKKPAGGVVMLTMGMPTGLVFVPVTDMNKLLEKVPVPLEDEGGGVSKVTTPTGEDVFIKESGGYAYITNDKANLGTLPADPVALLEGLDKKYNIAVQANMQNIPPDLKKMAIDGIEQGYRQGLENSLDGEDPDAQETIKKLSANWVKSVKQLVDESDQIMLGWGVDAMKRSTYVDFSMTAKQGTKLAKRFEALQDSKSRFGGFLLPDAGVTLNFVSELAAEDVEVASVMLTQMQTQALKEIDGDDDLNAEQRAAAKEVLSTLFSAITKTIESGKMDGGAALILAPDVFTFAAGGHVAGGDDLDKAFKNLVELGRKEPDFPEVKLDSETHNNVKFHTVSIPIPAGELEARKIFGEKMEAVVGIGADSVYLAVGKGAVPTLKKIMDLSTANADKVVPPSQLTVALTPIMEFAASVSDDANVSAIVDALKQTKGKDKILISSRAIERGGLTRFELEEGVLQAIGAGISAAQNAFGGGGGDF